MWSSDLAHSKRVFGDSTRPDFASIVVAYEQIDAEPLPPTGGALLDGTYVVTKVTVYTGPGGATGSLPGNPTVEETIVFTNGTYQASAATVSQNAPMATEYESGTSSIAGTKLTTATACPMVGSAVAIDYSASPMGLRVVVMLNGQSFETMLAKID